MFISSLIFFLCVREAQLGAAVKAINFKRRTCFWRYEPVSKNRNIIIIGKILNYCFDLRASFAEFPVLVVTIERAYVNRNLTVIEQF